MKTHSKQFDEVGGIPAGIVHIALPWTALTLAACLGVGLSLINNDLVRTHPEQNVVAAACCIVGAAMYLVYMVVNKLLSLFIRSINTEYNSIKLQVLEPRSRPPAGSTADHAPDEGVELGTDNPQTDDADADNENDDDDDGVQVLLAATSAPPRASDVVLREEVIASMYLGGAGAFLAVPSLCMWDTTVSAIFILSLQMCALPERIKVLEYRANVDRIVAINVLRALHWTQHALALVILALLLWRDQQVRVEPIVWQLCALAACSPPLLKAGSQHWASSPASALSPTHALESGLPVSTLLAILVLCWYSPVEVILERHVSWSRAICLMSMNPPALAVTITFILRGFRRYHSLGVVVVLTTLAVIRRQWFTSEWNERGIEVAMVLLTVLMGAVAASRAFYRVETVSSDELSYAEVYGSGRRKPRPRLFNLQHSSPYP